MRGIIYKYTNKYNNKVYIGQTINEERRREKWKCLGAPYAGDYINRARKKYGIEAFLYEVLTEVISDNKEVLRQTLNNLEQYYIALYNSKDENFGYNLSDGGKAGVGQVITKETRRKMSLAQKGKKKSMSEQGKKNISLSHKGPRPWTHKKVCQIDKNTNQVIKVWESVTEAIHSFGDKTCGNLIAAIKNKYRHKYYRGYKWQYYEA